MTDFDFIIHSHLHLDKLKKSKEVYLNVFMGDPDWCSANDLPPVAIKVD